MKKIGILGSTGSVGSEALEIINEYKNKFELVFISGNLNASKLIEQTSTYNPQFICLVDKQNISEVKNKTNNVKVLSGYEGLLDLCDIDVDIVLNAISGYKGLSLSMKIIENGIDLALANKESIVQAGSILMDNAKKNNVNIFPVDSEHSALWQCLIGENKNNIDKLILTGSGGPFRLIPKEKLYYVKKEEALNHPNWSMGNKITIDSATMMNKGFELIEAHWLFDIPYEKIDIVIHPESIIHSMIKFIDGSIKAQLSIPTMRIPIQFALTYPERYENKNIEFDFIKNNQFTFEKVDYEKFRCIELAYQSGKSGGTYPTVLNVSNDLAVDLYLKNKINFGDIQMLIEEALDSHSNIQNPTLSDIKDTIVLTEQYINNFKVPS